LFYSQLTASRVLHEFLDLRWVPLKPKFIDYPNAQFLLIGTRHGDSPTPGKKQLVKESSKGEESGDEGIEILEYEDELRSLAGKSWCHFFVSSLRAHFGLYRIIDDDPVFDILAKSTRADPNADVPTTWK
jgi:hypothetical protein